MSFSVKGGVTIPPSLKNIFQELKDDLNITPPQHGNLSYWATQGVLLLNTILTVRANKPKSHADRGWEIFSDRIIEIVAEQKNSLVFLLWGKQAQQKINSIDTTKHTVIKSAHPSPYSAKNGFFGSRPFSRANLALEKAAKAPIDWRIPN